MRWQGSDAPNGKTLFVSLRGVWAFWSFGISFLLVLASPGGSVFQQLTILVCMLSLGVVFWAITTTLSAISARESGRPGTGRIDAIEPAFTLHHPKKWHENIVDRSKARLVFTDNFGIQHKTLAHPRTYFGELKIGQHIGAHVGKKRTWWNGDIGYRRTKSSASGEPAGQTE